MTAPKPLPPCPVCGRAPIRSRIQHSSHLDCYRVENFSAHGLSASGSTRAIVEARWRRLAGGRK